jgi:phosphoglycolate phosphatase-like HAD superfamily hydrolase
VTRVVVFDFDGVLVDSNAVKRDAYALVFARFGDTARLVADGLDEQPDGNRFQVIGRVLDRVRAAGLLPAGEPAGGWVEHLAGAYNDICEHHQATCSEVPGASEAIAALAPRAALYVNSATWEEPLRRVVRRRRWDRHFRGVCGSPATKVENLRRIQSAEAVPPGDIVFVGDGRRDVAAAREVGCRFVGVRNPFNDFDPAGLELIDDLRDLPDALGMTKD